MVRHFADQGAHPLRFEWGEQGLRALAVAGPSTFVVVDVLSFSTCVVVAVERGASILPYAGAPEDAAAHARAHGALLAGRRGDPDAAYSLSPATLLGISAGARLLLPSPNGARLSLEASRHGTVVAGCLRNRRAVASYLREVPGPVAVLAAGERWPDGTLRPCLEDQLGAGAILAALPGPRSPEADAAVAAWEALRGRGADALLACSSGRELVERGHRRDVEIASEVDRSASVPVLGGAGFGPVGPTGGP